MTARETPLPGLLVIEPVVHRDERGFFVESYRDDRLAEIGVEHAWVQDNHARSERGVRRGLHFVLPPGQAKLVRCVHGAIMDVCVDLRRGSPTFGRWHGEVLDDVDCRMLYVPVGFAHGYAVMSPSADVVYRCSDYYSPDREREISSDDPQIGIVWPPGPAVLSERDRNAPLLRDVADALPFVFS